MTAEKSSAEKTSAEKSFPTNFVVRLARLQLWLAAFAVFAMMMVTVADVFMRYLFNNPVRGTYDFTEAMLVVFVFHGMAACFLTRSNIVIDLIDNFVGPASRDRLERVGDFVSLAVLLIFTYAAWHPATQAFGDGETKLQLGLPIFALWVVALLGLAGTIIAALWMFFVPAATSPSEGASS